MDLVDLSHSTSSASFSRILVAENHVSTVGSLIRTCRDTQLQFDFDVCTSHHCAARKLLASPYQLIISSVPLAEKDDCLLLDRTRALEAFVPVVITAAREEQESARRVLDRGAFDLIPIPLNPEQAVSTIRLALWHHKLNALIASRNKTLERYRQHINGYPGDKSGEAYRTMLTSIEQSIALYERNIHQIETSLKCLTTLAKRIENQAGELALKRLDRLSTSSPRADYSNT